MNGRLNVEIDIKLYFEFLAKVSLKKYIFVMLGMIVCINREYFCADLYTLIGATVISLLLFLLGIIPENRVLRLFIDHGYIKNAIILIIGFLIIIGLIITAPSGASIVIIFDFLFATMEFIILQNQAFKLSILDMLEDVINKKEGENNELQGRNSD